MSDFYVYFLLAHLAFAVIFVGFLFWDVVIFRAAKKRLSEAEFERSKQAIFARASKIMPPCVLGLLLTGGAMAPSWIGREIGFFDSNLQKIFILKIIFACAIFLAVAVNLSAKFIFKKPSPLGDIHPLALTLAVGIIICAKLMFFV